LNLCGIGENVEVLLLAEEDKEKRVGHQWVGVYASQSTG